MRLLHGCATFCSLGIISQKNTLCKYNCDSTSHTLHRITPMMLHVQIDTASGVKQIHSSDSPLKVYELRDLIPGLRENFYVVHNGKLVDENVTCYNGYISIVPRLFGGKGGFGSMLRAIGAQIEKTTNREACRDLSGRRLRDINEEKRLKAWIEKQGKRDEEAAERKKKKLERLCAEPRHEFKDHTYEKERSALTERVGDAVEEGFKLTNTGVKRKHKKECKPNKKKMLLDINIDSDELDSSDDTDEEEAKFHKTIEHTGTISNDSGHSSEENEKITQNKNKTVEGYSETSSENGIDSKNVNFAENEENIRTE